MASNMFSTSTDKDNQLVIGHSLTSISSTYKVQSLLGQGTFGTVAKCMQMKDMKVVAIKLMKNEGCYIEQAEAEVAALRKLKCLDKRNLVHWDHVFTDKGYICLVFEQLDKSLFDFMKKRHFQPLLLKEIRPIVQQVASALSHLKSVGIIHADLKMENVMLVNHRQEPYRVKLIDFGLAHEVSAGRAGSYIQTRPYRAPEILLGLPFTEAIDMWSLGCMAVCMYMGTILYPGRNEYDVMRWIVETQGQPPDHLLNFGYKTSHFFQRDNKSTTSLWKLKSPEHFHQETGIQPMKTRPFRMSSLDDLYHVTITRSPSYADKAAEMHDVVIFVELLKAMLELDAAKRITPHQLLEHQFTRMSHIASLYHLSHHVRSCYEIMSICWNNKPDSKEAACGSMDQSHRINPHPCASTHTTSSDRSWRKRKVDEDKNAEDMACKESNSDHCQRSEYYGKRSRKSPAGPSTSRSHRQTSSHTSTRVTMKRVHAEDFVECEESDHDWKRARKSCADRSTCSSTHSSHTRHIRPEHSSSPAELHYPNAHPSSCTQTEIRPWAGMKRKADDADDVRPRKRSSKIHHIRTERGLCSDRG